MALLVLLTSVSRLDAQSSPGAAKPGAIRVNLYNHLGSVQLPASFSGVVDANWNDAWAGVIGPVSSPRKISWRAGLIQYVGEHKRKEDIVGQWVLANPNASIRFTQFRDADGETLVARIGSVEFSTVLTTPDDEKIFMSIVRSYQKERCVCRSLPIKTVD